MPFSLRQARAIVPFVALAVALCGQVQRAVGLGGGAAPAPPAPRPTQPPELQPTFDWLAKRIDTLHEDRRDVADGAWHLLMLSAAHQTLRQGPHRNAIKTVAAWLRNVQDDEGRFAPNGVPCGRRAQLLSAVAIATAQRDANGLWPASPGLEQSTTNAMLALALVHVPEPTAEAVDAPLGRTR